MTVAVCGYSGGVLAHPCLSTSDHTHRMDTSNSDEVVVEKPRRLMRAGPQAYLSLYVETRGLGLAAPLYPDLS